MECLPKSPADCCPRTTVRSGPFIPFQPHKRCRHSQEVIRQCRRQSRQETACNRHLLVTRSSAAVQQAETASSDATDETFRLTIDTAEARKSVRFTEVKDKGERRIVVDAVAVGCQAEAEGVRPGQRLLALSDPIRTSEEWEITPTTSLSRIRDAVQFRRPPTITLLLSVASVQDDATWSLENAAWTRSIDEVPQPEEAGNESGAGTASSGGLQSELLANITERAEDATADNGSTDDGSLTIAQQLEAEQRRAQLEATEQETRYKARVQKRRDYMERESGRNDTPFFALLAAFFVLPAAVILAIAFSSGYLDTLAQGYKRF